MVIGLLTVELLIEGADSLKDKRQVLKSLLAHLRQEFNISAAEVDHHDLWRRATIGIAVVASDGSFADQVMSKVTDHIQSDPRVVLAQVHTELL